MHRVLLLGAGKIGRTIARLLTDSGDYEVLVADADSKALDRLTGRSKIVDATNTVNFSGELPLAQRIRFEV